MFFLVVSESQCLSDFVPRPGTLQVCLRHMHRRTPKTTMNTKRSRIPHMYPTAKPEFQIAVSFAQQLVPLIVK